MPRNIAEILEPVLLSGFITEGPKAKQFETAIQNYIGNPYTAIVNSGTSALTLALRLAGVGPGTEVITSPMTCLATNEPVLALGGDIVWCDVDPKTGNIDASKIEQLITGKTRAILFVDWSGTPAELDTINDIANRHGLKTVEDAAQAFGSRYKGSITGTRCDFSCFSFQAIKHLTTIDGGAVACKTKEDYERTILLRWFGLSRGHNTGSSVCWTGDVLEHGYKMHISDVHAALGLEQLKYIDNILETHKLNGNFLLKELSRLSKIETCAIPNYTEPSFWFFTILLKDAAHRKQVSAGLASYGVASGISHTRNDAYSLFGKYVVDLPGVTSFGSRMLNIPCGWWVTNDDLHYIVEKLEEVS
jgi:dTDP-4-amino-4,6-dideoxygalactose transaminase